MTSAVMVLFFFMMVFMDTTATIPTGAMAERWAWKNFCSFGLWIALPYCLYANWVWGGGWLAQGGSQLGPRSWSSRLRRFRCRARDGWRYRPRGRSGPLGRASANTIRRVDRRRCPAITFRWSSLGTFILAFGWFGFNPGSTLAGTDLRISFVVVNTMLASVIAGQSARTDALMMKGLKPDPTMMCNGMLAGLVAITAPCAFVDPWAAAVIGVVAGWLVVVSVFFWEGAQSMIRWARSPSTGSMVFGACCRLVSSRPDNMAPAGTVWFVKRW